MFCCSPPPRDAAAQEACWRASRTARCTFTPPTMRPTAWRASCPRRENHLQGMANGVPGLELRLPLLSRMENRITLEEFVNLTATRHAQTYGLYPRRHHRRRLRCRHRDLGPGKEMTVETTTTAPATRLIRGACSPAGRSRAVARRSYCPGRQARRRAWRGRFLERSASPRSSRSPRRAGDRATQGVDTPLQL